MNVDRTYGVGLLQALDYFRSGVNDSWMIRASVSAPQSSKLFVNRSFKAVFMLWVELLPRIFRLDPTPAS
jgi:hypothetical protein